MKKTILFLTILFLTSCGVRKVNKSVTTEKSTVVITDTTSIKTVENTKVNTNVKETTTITVDKKTNVVKETTEVTPIDATKKAVYTDEKGRKYDLDNAKYKNEKTTDLSSEKTVSIKDYNKAITLAKNAYSLAQNLLRLNKELERKLDAKNTEHKTSYWFLLWFLLIVPVYYLVRKCWWV